MKQDKLFSEIYKIDASTNLYMIEIALDQHSDIFSKWDAAPFKRRDIDPDLKLYLEGSSEEIPLHYPIELCFIIPEKPRDQQIEEESQNGLKNSFLFKLYLLNKEIKKTNLRTLHCVFLGFICLGLGAIFLKRFPDNVVFLMLLADALVIGGWVFLWEAVSLFFFTNRELYHSYRIYKRLKNAPVFFREAEKF